MKKTLSDIASHIAGEANGNPKLPISGVSSIEEAKESDITFAFDEKAVERYDASPASAAVVPKDLKKFPNKPYISVNNPRLAMAKVLGLFDPKRTVPSSIHKSAVISKTARLGKDITIMPGVVIGENTSIGDKVKIFPGCYVGNDCKIGRDTVLYPNAVIYDRTIIGNRCVIHGGAVIGVDGYGFAPFDGKYEKIPQIGNVVVEDDVEIFANVSISRATMGSTIIKRGTKIDNLTHIAHNCKIGEDCAITGLVAIAGSTELKNHVSIGGTSGVNDHVVIGENTVIMGRSGVTKDIPANSVVSGFPAQDHKKELEQQAAVRRLPKIIEKLSELEQKINKQ